MYSRPRLWAAGLVALSCLAAVSPAAAQKQGGTLRMPLITSPASMSIHEESTIAVLGPVMGVFNNLVMFDQHVPQNSLSSIVPDRAESWNTSEDGKSLTFKLRPGVTWHDGKPFTAADVKCTFDLVQDKGKEHLRKNPRKLLWNNVDEVVPNGDLEVTFRLGRPQPSLLALLASGYTAIYPCHATPAQQRTKPIGTGPFMLAEFKQNEMIRLVRNPNYWKPGRPYLDAIELPIITNRATAMLAFQAHKLDMTFPVEVTPAIQRDITKQVPTAICSFGPMNVNSNLIVNRSKPPFDHPEIRRAMALTIDRKAFVDILFEGKADIGGSLLPAPEGIWGMPDDMKRSIPGYDPDV